MSTAPDREIAHLAYPEPPASPLWHRRGTRTRRLTAEQQRRNRELLLHAKPTPRPSSSNTRQEGS
ncbi:hypothetical protein AB0D13_23240 [Streptomyces sp. NPDC048430]|uniref:hypothetical protein n=1 Tax=Streptomyces sp. NPDC048430 TaxID=3155388 RepID=UPI00341C556E